jgi:hypothetical protein
MVSEYQNKLPIRHRLIWKKYYEIFNGFAESCRLKGVGMESLASDECSSQVVI